MNRIAVRDPPCAGASARAKLALLPASGSGEDEATWASCHAAFRAPGVWAHADRKSITIDGREGREQAFVREVRLPLPEAMRGLERYVVLLNGFDLVAAGDADKLASFHLLVTPPAWDAARQELVYSIVGGLNVDCDSAECDGYPSLGDFLAGLAAGLATGRAAAAALVALLPSLWKKLDLGTRYDLVVHTLVVGGRRDTLAVTPSRAIREYGWDERVAIQRPDVGVVTTTIQGDPSPRWSEQLVGLSQISLEVTRERGFFRPDTAMHLLQWDTCVLPKPGRAAEVHLFFGVHSAVARWG